MHIRLHLGLRFSIAALGIAVLLAGCGQGTVGPSGTEVTVHVVDSQGNSVNGEGAFQTGSESWESLAPESTGTYTFLVPDGTSRYGFAVNCPSGLQGSSTKAMVYQLTVEEATETRVTCPVSFVGSVTEVGGSYDSSAFGATSAVDVYTKFESATGLAAGAGTYGPLTIRAGGDQTIVAVAEDGTADPVAVKVLRNLNLTTASTVNVTFEAGDAVGSTTTPDFSATVPGGWSPNMTWAFVAENNQFVTLASASSSASASVPTVPSTLASDLYLGLSSANEAVAPNRTVATFHFKGTPSGMDLELPDPWTTAPSASPAVLPTFNGLAPLPNETNFRGHLLIYLWNGIPDETGNSFAAGAGIIQAFVSTGWLGGSTAYPTPDLTGVAGFLGAKPLSGENASWIAGSVSSSLPMGDFLTAPAFPFEFSSGILSPLYAPLVDGVINRIALVQDSYTVP